MNSEQFDHIMERWAEHDTQAAPALRPTPAVYQHLVAHRQVFRSRVAWRWAAAGAAVALVTGLLVSHPYVFRTSLPKGGPPIVDLRRGFEAEKGGLAGPVPGRGPGRGPKGKMSDAERAFGQLLLEHQARTSRVVQSIDLRLAELPSLALGADDNYRLVLAPSLDSYVYVFQTSPDNRLIRLFPERRFTPAVNPLRAGATTIVPAAPDWFHLGATRSKDRLFILLSPQPRPDWGAPLPGLRAGGQYRERA